MELKTIVEAIIIVIVIAFLIILPTKGYTIIQYIMSWDVEEGITPMDVAVASMLRKIKKPIF